MNLPPTPICDKLVKHFAKVLEQYREGAIFATEAVANIFNSCVEDSDELQEEIAAVVEWEKHSAS